MEIREALTAAFEKEESGSSSVAETQAPSESSATEVPDSSPKSYSAPSEKLETKKEDSKEPLVAKKVLPTPSKFGKTKPPVPGMSDATKPPAEGATNRTEIPKAPYSWNAQAKEKWSLLPPEVQKEALRVDMEARTAIQQAGEAKKFHQTFKEAISPYEGIIRASGAEPIQVIGSLLQTVSALRMGSPQQKASIIANIVKNNQVDIQMLDQALAGAGGQSQGPQMPGEFRDPRFDQFISQLEAQKSQKLQLERQRAVAEIQKFATEHEFVEDLPEGMMAPKGSVRALMAEFLEVDNALMQQSLAAGIPHTPMTPDEAYERACRMHPDVSKVIQQREMQRLNEAQRPDIERRKLASSSIRSQPTGPVQTNGRMSLRETLANNWAAINNT